MEVMGNKSCKGKEACRSRQHDGVSNGFVSRGESRRIVEGDGAWFRVDGKQSLIGDCFEEGFGGGETRRRKYLR